MMGSMAFVTFMRNLIYTRSTSQISTKLRVPMSNKQRTLYFKAQYHLRGFQNEQRKWEACKKKPGGHCYWDVVENARKYQVNGTVFMVVVGIGGYDVILNWCVSMKRLNLENYFLVAVTNDAYNFFLDKGAPIAKGPRMKLGGARDKGDVWVERTFAAHMILRAGINVVISDADAVMMKSPFGNAMSMFDNESIDIISTPSNFPNPSNDEIPEDCPRPPIGYMEWRHRPCMGWILFRSNNRVMKFFTKNLLPDVVKYRDDQIGFNCAIRKGGALWRDGDKWSTRKAMITDIPKAGLRMVVLPGANYLRNCSSIEAEKRNGYGIWKFNAEDVEMYHCKGHAKKDSAENNGFWFLRDDWERMEVMVGNPFSYYLTMIMKRGEA